MHARVLVVSLLAVIAAPAALAQEHKCPAAGTEVRTTVTGANGSPIRYEGGHGLWCLRTRNGQAINSELGHLAFFAPARQNSDAAMKLEGVARELWPLAPGKSATTMVQEVSDGSSAGAVTSNSMYRWEFNVEAPRTITVPAGTFTVIPIVHDVIGTSGNYHRGQFTYYYAPDLGTNAKFDYKIVHGSNARPAQPWELVSFKAPGAQ